MLDPTLHLHTFAHRWEQLRPPPTAALLPESPAARAWSEFDRLRPALIDQLGRHEDVLRERIVALAQRRATWHDDQESLLAVSTLWVLARDIWDVLLAPHRDHVTQLIASARGWTGGPRVDESLACSVVEETLSSLEGSRRSRIWRAGAPLRGRSNFELQNIHALVQSTARYRLRDRRIEPLDDPDALCAQQPGGLREARHRQARQIARLALAWSAAAAGTRPRGRGRQDAVASVLVRPEGPATHREEQARSRIRMDAQVRAAIIYEQWTGPGDWARSMSLQLAEPSLELAGAESLTCDLLGEATGSWLDLMRGGLREALDAAVSVADPASNTPGLRSILVDDHQYYSVTEPRRGAQIQSYIEAARQVGRALCFDWRASCPPDPSGGSGRRGGGRAAARRGGGAAGQARVGAQRGRGPQAARLWRLVLQVIERGEASIDDEPEFHEVVDILGGPPVVAEPAPRWSGAWWRRIPVALAAAVLLAMGAGLFLHLHQDQRETVLLAPQPVPWLAWPAVIDGGVPVPWSDGDDAIVLAHDKASLDIAVDRSEDVGPLRAVAFFLSHGDATLVYDATIPADRRSDPAPRRRTLPPVDGRLVVVVAADVDGLVGTEVDASLLDQWLETHDRRWSASVEVEAP